MATTYEEIIGFLKEEQIKFRDLRDENGQGLLLQFSKSEHDDMPEVVLIVLEENGEFIRFMEPQRYKFVQGEHKVKVFETLLTIQNETKMLQWEYDAADGEIRASIELPLEDAPLTKRLFLRALMGLVRMTDGCHERIRAVMETGEDPGRKDPRAPAISALEEMLSKLRDEVPDAI